MIHPHDDVVFRCAVLGDRNRLAAGTDSDQRTGRIDTDGANSRRVDRRLDDSFFDDRTSLRPDIGRRLFDIKRARMKLGDGADRKRQALPSGVKNSGPYAGRSDIDTNKETAAHLFSQSHC